MAYPLGIVIVAATLVLAAVVARYALRILHSIDALMAAKAQGQRLRNIMVQRELDADDYRKGPGFHG